MAVCVTYHAYHILSLIIQIDTTCPVAMQDGAARLLRHQLGKADLDSTHRTVFQNAYNHLISRVPGYAWTSGQWMTERAGGSDVSQTETIATYAPYPQVTDPPLANADESIPLGPWSISGFKWFSSATDSSMTILLAKTTPDKGVSAFLAPMQKHTPITGTTTLNGVRIIRLKDKMGTKPLPTAELELTDMRGWLIGAEGHGLCEIATILTITRLHSAITALGYLGRGLAVAKGYALHMRTLAGMVGEYHAMLLLTFYTAYVLGLDEHRPQQKKEKEDSGRESLLSSSSLLLRAFTPPPQHVAPLLRVLASLPKAYVCKHAIPLMYGCMEALGGVRYLNNAESEHLNLSRLFRDLCVLATWEGTTNVLATDVLRALLQEGGGCLAAVDWVLGVNRPPRAAWEAWRGMRARIVGGGGREELLAEARDVSFLLAEVVMASLLEVDVQVDGDETAGMMRDRFLVKRGFAEPGLGRSGGGKSTLEVDTAIVFGDQRSDGLNTRSRL